MTRRTPHQTLGVLAAGSAVVFTAVWLAASATEPGYQPARDDLSSLETTTAHHPWIMIGGDLILAAGIAALAWAIRKTARCLDAEVTTWLLATTAAAITVQALAREDCNTAAAACIAREHAGTVTWHHHLHGPASVLGFLTILGAALVLARPLREIHQRGLAAYSIVTAAIGSIALLASIVTPPAYSGLAERAFITIPVAWVLILGLHLTRPTPTPHDATLPP